MAIIDRRNSGSGGSTNKVDKPSGSTPGFVATVDATGSEIEYVAPTPSPYIAINSTGTGATANGTDSVVIGEGATDSVGAVDATLVGKGASSFANDVVAVGAGTTANDLGSVALGHAASAFGVDTISVGRNAVTFGAGAVQFGQGSNASANTVQFLTNRLANAQGLYTSFTAPANYTPADTDNVTSHFQGIDAALGAVTDTSIYNANGTITAARSIDGGGNPVVFSNGFLWSFLATNSITLDAPLYQLGNGSGGNLPGAQTDVTGRSILVIQDSNNALQRVDRDVLLREQVAAEVSAAAVSSVIFSLLPVDSTSNTVLVAPLSSPVAGDWFEVVDSREQASTNNITVDFVTATQNLYATSQNYVISLDGERVKFTYINATIGWVHD